MSNSHITTDIVRHHYYNNIGSIIYSRDKSQMGIVKNVYMRECTCCGRAPCYHVKWDDGKVTKPCVGGVQENPDGTLQIV